jgi:hypothetical protein
MILDVKFLDPNLSFVFAATSGDLGQANALTLKTTDGGPIWRQVYRSNRRNEIMWKALFPDSCVGYATVQNHDPSNVRQHIVKTVDAGEHWSEIPPVANKEAEVEIQSVARTPSRSRHHSQNESQHTKISPLQGSATACCVAISGPEFWRFGAATCCFSNVALRIVANEHSNR